MATVSTLPASATIALQLRDGRYYQPNSGELCSGYFKGYFNNHTRVRAEGKLTKGLMNDVWKFYFPNGKLKREVEFEAGKKLKVHRSFYRTGEIESLYDEDEQVYTQWYKSGRLKSVTHYLDGEKQGNSLEWYENGKVKREYRHYMHHEHGIYKEYHSNGKVAFVSVFRDGEKCHFWQAFYPDGKLKYRSGYRPSPVPEPHSVPNGRQAHH